MRWSRAAHASTLGQCVRAPPHFHSRSPSAADFRGPRWQVPRAHGSYEALLADPTVQAVYVATPHPQHLAWIIRAAEAGKHVLCEARMVGEVAA